MNNEALARLQASYSKLQAKANRQSDEINRLVRELRALKDDLADIREQRDRLAHEKRAREAAKDFQDRETFSIGPGY